MKKTVVFVALGVAAVLLGLFAAIPLFDSNLNHPAQRSSGGRAYITTDVVYAYFALNPYNEETAGLSRSSINTVQTRDIVSYLLVMNVTSYSNTTVYMDNFSVYAAQYMDTINTPNEITRTITQQFLESHRITDGATDRSYKSSPTVTKWEPDQSRLVVFSGTAEVKDPTSLRSGTFYVGGEASGTPIDGISSRGVGSKQITAETVGNDEFLYNNLLGSNQVLRLIYDGQIAYVDEGQ